MSGCSLQPFSVSFLARDECFADFVSDVDLIIATLNCLCILVKNRAVFHSTILSAIFAFEVHQLGIDQDTTIGKLQIRFVDKALRVILTHLLKWVSCPVMRSTADMA